MALAGWALDHQAGLAMKGLQFVPRQPSGTRDHPEYLQLRSVVDDHAHERNGAFRNGDLDPIVARRLLVNLLYANPGGFQFALQQMAMEALKALDYGEVQPMLARLQDGRKRGLTVRRLELRAVGFVEYRRTRFGNKARALQDVASALGVGVETIRSWERRLRREFGDLEVLRTLSFAHNSATNEDDAQRRGDKGDVNARPGLWDARYGVDALQELGRRYQEALRQ
jgi:hypothetical protein